MNFTSILVVAAAATYSAAVFGGLARQPGNWRWGLRGGAIACALLVMAAVFRRLVSPTALRNVAIVYCLVAVMATVASGRSGAVIVVLFLLAVCHGSGLAIVRFCRLDDDPWERHVLSLAAGMVLAATLYLALAAVKLLFPWTMWVAAVSAAVLARRSIRETAYSLLRTLRPAPSERSPSFDARAAVVAGGGFVLFVFIWSLAPEVQFDALNYHLASPRDYLAAHGIVAPLSRTLYLAHIGEAVYGVAMAMGGEGGAKLVAGAVGVLTGFAAATIARRLAGREAGIWTGLLFLSTPLVFGLSVTADTDLFVALFLAAAVLALMRGAEGETGRRIAAGAAFSGAAVGCKLTALFAIPALAFAGAFALIARRQGARAWIAAAAAGLVAVLPWYAVNYAFTGTPIYPIPSRLFPGKGVADATAVYSLFGIGKSWKSALTIVPELTFRAGRFGESLSAGSLGLSVLLAPLLFLALIRRHRARALAAAVAASYLVAWWMIVQYGRYLVSIYSVLIPGVAALLPWRLARAPRVLRVCFVTGIVAQSLVIAPALWSARRFGPVAFAFGRVSRDAYLAHALPAYGAVQWLNRSVGPGEKVIEEGMEGIRYYVRPPILGIYESEDLRRTMSLSDPAEIARRIAAGGFQWICLGTPETAGAPSMIRSIAEKFGRLEGRAGTFSIYRLVAPLSPATGAP